MRKILPAVVVAAGLAVAACGGAAASHAPPAVTHTAVAAPQPSSQAVAAVPGSHNNEYVVGPFTITMNPAMQHVQQTAGVGTPQPAAEVTVKDTSATYRGWAQPVVEFVSGHSLHGTVVDTEKAVLPAGGDDPTDFNVNDLAPGQSSVMYAFPSIPAGVTFVTVAMTDVSYGPAGSVAATVQLNTGG